MTLNSAGTRRTVNQKETVVLNWVGKYISQNQKVNKRIKTIKNGAE